MDIRIFGYMYPVYNTTYMVEAWLLSTNYVNRAGLLDTEHKTSKTERSTIPSED